MARELKIDYAALNITTHPHSTKNYVALFTTIKRLKAGIRIYGDRFCTMSFLHKLKKDQTINEPLSGELVTYTQIDVDGEWYNFTSEKVSSDEDLYEINIPEHLKPNCSRFSFIFFPDTHTFVFETKTNGKSLTPNLTEKYFKKIFEQLEKKGRFKNLSVFILKEPDEIERIINAKNIRSITLVTNRPNPDDLSKTEDKIKRKLKKMKAIKEERTLKAEKGSELSLDSETKMEARVAAKNGIVKTKNINEKGKIEERSSENVPLIRTSYYDQSTTTQFDVLLHEAYSIKESISRWID